MDTIKIKYKDLGSFEIQTAIQKIANTAMPAPKAAVISHLIKSAQAVRTQMSEEYKTEVMEKFAQKNEDGSLKRPEGDPQSIIPIEGKEEEMQKANIEFGEKFGELKYMLKDKEIIARPLTPSLLADVKLSPKDLEALKDLYSDEEGPGVPSLGPQLVR